MTKKNDACAILFSGGTDSTLAAAIQQEKFQFIHLITFSRFGIASVENSKVNAQKLIDKYGKDRITHEIINFDKAFKFISYENYFSNLRKHGFLNLSTCGLCKLSMHMKAIDYCLENNIFNISDGANQGMNMFPAQMEPVIIEIKKLYDIFKIDYTNPVFNYEAPEDSNFISMENSNLLKSIPKPNVEVEASKKTAGKALFEMGLAPMPNVKGSVYDRKRQPRCFQFILFKIFANKYFLAGQTYEQYVEKTTSFFKDKVKAAELFLKEKD